jgi:16S rRNA (cytidine1402-2'-O)-methyltransferase
MHADIRRPALYVVATPIGNLADITLRALDTLRAVDVVAAEDTRVTARLLAHFDIAKTVLALHQHNERQAAARLLRELDAGRAVALVSDAGTPALSDPGAALIAQVRLRGFDVVPIPGASALAAAWSVAGMTETGFLFHGFLPARAGERRKLLASLARLAYALVFYEAPHRVLETASDLSDVLGEERRVVVFRELTKMFETVHSCTLGELRAWLEADDNRRRGELVLIVGAAKTLEPQRALGEEALRILLEELKPAQAARLAGRLSGVPKSELYELAVRARGED